MPTHVVLGLVALIMPLIAITPDTETLASHQNNKRIESGPQKPVPQARQNPDAESPAKPDDGGGDPAGSPRPESPPSFRPTILPPQHYQTTWHCRVFHNTRKVFHSFSTFSLQCS